MPDRDLPVEYFPALSGVTGVRHAFATRAPGIEMSDDKTEALERLDFVHREIRVANGAGEMPFITAQQVHGNQIGVTDRAIEADKCFSGCDGLITNQRGICIGIYVADCCAVYLVDPVRNAIGLVHSGKKGTELGVVPAAIQAMAKHFGSRASDLITQLSPCIRPPHYEIDFAAKIRRQIHAAGILAAHDGGVCTACDLDRYYSYRAEKGRTGRMLALLALTN